MSEIVIENVEADSNVLRSEISHSPELQRFFSDEDFLAEYSVDVDDVPESILTIPVLAQVCPVAWFQGADVYVDTVDADFYESLQTVKRVLLDMYPDLMQGGDVYSRDVVESDHGSEFDRSGLLFTGGIDSTFSFIRHRDEDPALININGWALRNDEHEKWSQMKNYLEEFSDRNGVEDLYIRYNMLSFLRNAMLIAYCDPYVLGAWYSSIGHGLGLLGLCAPLAHSTGISNLYMAATHWEGAAFPWGSRPSIVENMAWDGTENHHDGYEYSRHERIEVIARYIEEEDPNLTLLTCSNEISENCGYCEKCCRTAIAMLVAGVDPNEHGLHLSSETFDRVRSQLETGKWKLSANKRLYWRDLQSHVPSRVDSTVDGADEFFEWLREADFEAYADRERKPMKQRLVYPVYRNIPYRVFNALDSRLEIGPFGTY